MLTFVDSRTAVTVSYDLNKLSRYRGFSYIGPAGTTPGASVVLAEYDEGLITFANTTSTTTSFNFVFSDVPDAVVLTIDSGASPNTNINIYGVSYDATNLTVQSSAAISGTVRYRAVYSSVGYPANVTSSLEPTSGTFSVSAGKVTSSLTTYTASYVLADTIDLFLASVWDEGTNYDANVKLTGDVTGSAQSTGHLSSNINAATKIHFITVSF